MKGARENITQIMEEEESTTENKLKENQSIEQDSERNQQNI